MYDMKPYLKRIDEVIKKGPYKDTWESLSQYQAPIPLRYNSYSLGCV